MLTIHVVCGAPRPIDGALTVPYDDFTSWAPNRRAMMQEIRSRGRMDDPGCHRGFWRCDF